MSKVGWNTATGVVDESTYGTYVAPTRWFEYTNFAVTPQIERLASNAIRYGRMNRARTLAYASFDWGQQGTYEIEVPTKGFGFWMKHMMGAVATATVTTGVYTHTGSVASLTGDSFSMQALLDGEVFGLAGGKVLDWEFSAAVGDLLTVAMTLDFKARSTPAAGTPSFIANSRPLSFAGGTLTVGGSAVDVKEVSVRGENNLAVDERKYLGAVRKEPLDQGRNYTGSFTPDFEGTASGSPYHRFINGTEGALNLVFNGPVISGGHNFSLTIDAPVARLDSGAPEVDGPELIELTSDFVILDDALTLIVKTDEATP